MLLLAAAVLLTQSPAPDKPATRPTKKIVLFDGRSLAPFYVWLRGSKYEDPQKVFSIKNKLLCISGQDWGGIATRDSFRDYHLIVEWKWGGPAYGDRKDKARDSGVLVHAHGEDGAASGVWLESIEAQIIEGGTGDLLLVAGKSRPSLTVETRTGPDKQLYWERGGVATARDRGRFNWYGRDVNWKDALGYRGPRDIEKPAGQWNRYEITCDGASITNKLNGVIVNAGSQATPSEGKIQFQSEGAEILIRRIELRPLPRRK